MKTQCSNFKKVENERVGYLFPPFSCFPFPTQFSNPLFLSPFLPDPLKSPSCTGNRNEISKTFCFSPLIRIWSECYLPWLGFLLWLYNSYSSLITQNPPKGHLSVTEQDISHEGMLRDQDWDIPPLALAVSSWGPLELAEKVYQKHWLPHLILILTVPLSSRGLMDELNTLGKFSLWFHPAAWRFQ